MANNTRRNSYFKTDKCWFCSNLTSGRFRLHGIMLCFWCYGRYRNIPSYVPSEQWRMYIEKEGRRKKMSFL